MIRSALFTAILLFTSTVLAQLPDGLYAVFDTTMGEITCRLDYEKAPLTCANFVGLAEGSLNWVDPESGVIRNDPFFQELIFHRVIDDFMIQSGCPIGTGTSGPGYAIPDEFDAALTHSGSGILSMANFGPDSNGSQFFITLEATSWLDNYHSVFGEVVDGMNIIQAIGAVTTNAYDRPLTDVVITGITILRIGNNASDFDPAALPLPKVEACQLSVTAAPELSITGIDALANIRLFESTNLTDWALTTELFFTESVSDWNNPIPTDATATFFRAHQVVYKDSVTEFLDTAGKTLTFTQGTSVLVFKPEAGGNSGTCDIVGNADTLDYWADWTEGAYPGIIVFQPSYYAALKFIVSVDRTCRGYQWDGLDWNDVGPFSFTMSP